MKKKILALICAMALTAGLSMSVCAAGSPSAGGVAGSGSPSAGGVAGSGSPSAGDIAGSKSPSAGDVANSATSAPAPAEQLVASSENVTGQVITTDTLAFFQTDTKVSGVAGAYVQAVTPATAKAMIAQARAIAGANTFIASIVDLQVPAGTGTATFTLTCSNVWKGQNVTILHQKSDGSFESIKPSSVEDNKVTFTMTSYSPVAIVINTGAVSPKTGDITLLMAAMTAVFGTGTAVFARKARKN